ncbi:MAG: 23S rRNA (adenine(2030)-N(6))-methyltransferase RlmJ [Pseudomonadota bacterium]|nr:23S rRNA (adenine(2030)-N(6))-methyltransferase RlmJ [Pseudomonadota bacterium]
MLSYRHAFHAGNHADVLKHAVLVALLEHLGQKDKPWWYVDSHAGAGLYDLQGDYASRNGEFENGIARLWTRTDLPPMLAPYVEVVRGLNPDGRLRYYPGSPWCALQCARAEDRLRLFELHSTDHRLLAQNFADAGRRVRIETGDGFAGLRAVLPPPSRRGLVLIDPSYEIKTDYARVPEALAQALARFANGTYVIWYPLLQTSDSRAMLQQLRALRPPSWLHVSLSVQSPAATGFGMHGSGLFIVNPAWTLPGLLQATLPWLVDAMRQDAGAGFTLDHEIP